MKDHIKDKIYKTDKVDWRKFKFIQDHKFKNCTEQGIEKLIKSILENGSVDSFKVWEKDNELYCLDGYHRCQKAFPIMLDRGIDIPDKLTANFVECKNRKEAARYVLIYNARYAEMYEGGFYDFIEVEGLSQDWENISETIDKIHAIDLDKFEFDYIQERKEEETDVDELIDKAEELNQKWKVKNGDLWQIGEHRLYCGDATSLQSCELLLLNKKPNMIFIDPPYEMQGHDYIEHCLDLCDGHVFFMMTDREGIKVANQFIKYFRRMFTINFKVPSLINSTMPGTQTDKVFELRKGKNQFRNLRDAFSDYLEVNKTRKDKYHKQAKKIELPEKFVHHYTDYNCIVLDLFSGAGSTFMACERNNRVCFGVELAPKHCAVILERLELFGLKPELIEHSENRIAEAAAI